MTCLVLALVVGVIVYRVSLHLAFPMRDQLAQSRFSLLVSVTAACINLALIFGLSYLYYWLATKLTDMGEI